MEKLIVLSSTTLFCPACSHACVCKVYGLGCSKRYTKELLEPISAIFMKDLSDLSNIGFISQRHIKFHHSSWPIIVKTSFRMRFGSQIPPQGSGARYSDVSPCPKTLDVLRKDPFLVDLLVWVNL